MTELFLVRHGATPSNEHIPPILQGKGIDDPLSETGLRQAAAVGRFFAERRVSRIYCSGLRRTRETAEAIAAPHRLAVTPIEALHEIDVGVWQGKTWDILRRESPRELDLNQSDPVKYGHPGGENYQDVLDRVVPVFTRLLEEHAGEPFVVVAHNVVNRVYLAHLLRVPLSLANSIRQQNCGVNLIRRDQGITSVVTCNSVFHLEPPNAPATVAPSTTQPPNADVQQK